MDDTKRMVEITHWNEQIRDLRHQRKSRLRAIASHEIQVQAFDKEIRNLQERIDKATAAVKGTAPKQEVAAHG